MLLLKDIIYSGQMFIFIYARGFDILSCFLKFDKKSGLGSENILIKK